MRQRSLIEVAVKDHCWSVSESESNSRNCVRRSTSDWRVLFDGLPSRGSSVPGTNRGSTSISIPDVSRESCDGSPGCTGLYLHILQMRRLPAPRHAARLGADPPIPNIGLSRTELAVRHLVNGPDHPRPFRRSCDRSIQNQTLTNQSRPRPRGLTFTGGSPVRRGKFHPSLTRLVCQNPSWVAVTIAFGTELGGCLRDQPFPQS